MGVQLIIEDFHCVCLLQKVKYTTYNRKGNYYF